MVLLVDSSKVKTFIYNLIKASWGLFIFSFGVYFTIFANIGLAPWDCLSMAISGKISLSYGIVHTSISVIILVIDILLREKIGFGTILDAFLVGLYIDVLSLINPYKAIENNLILSVVLIIVGLFAMAYGQSVYMDAGMGCGPRDSLLVGVGRRFPKVPIGLIQGIILSTVLLMGFLLGGQIGIGTVVTTFGIGIAIQIVFSLIKFEPRKVKHQNIYESIKSIK